MTKQTSPALDLGQVQRNLQIATNNLRLASRAKVKADRDFCAASELHEAQRREFQAAVLVLQTSTKVPDPYAA